MAVACAYFGHAGRDVWNRLHPKYKVHVQAPSHKTEATYNRSLLFEGVFPGYKLGGLRPEACGALLAISDLRIHDFRLYAI
jgi:hypothetical protein